MLFSCSEMIRAFFTPIFEEVRGVANRIKGITVEIGGDTTGLDKALKSVNSSITKTQSALNDVNRLLKLDPSNTVLVAQKQELLAQAVSQTEEKLSALEAAQEQVAAAFARGDIGADKYQAFQREIEETRGKLNKYKADLSDLQTEQDALSLLAPQFMELMNEFRQRVEGQLLGFRWEGRVLSLAVETDYGFAAVASNVDLRDLDALHRSYCASLHAMEETLDLLLKNTALFAARD